MCNLSEGIAEEAWKEGMEHGLAQGMEQGLEKGLEQGMEQGAETKTIEVIKNLWRAGQDMSVIKIASGWSEEKIMQVVKAKMN